jgi:hypothetical protein
VIERRHFAALAGAVVLVLAVAGLIAWKLWGGPEQGSLAEPITVSPMVTPQQHLFGDPVRARVDVILDSDRIDPESVRVRANFAPYRPLVQPTRSQTAAGRITQVRVDYLLDCLGYRCLPNAQRKFDLHDATVEYQSKAVAGLQTKPVDWPPIQSDGRINPRRMWEAQLRGGDYRDLGPVTYRVSPTAVEVVALVLAVLFGAAALILILRLLPLARLAERLGLKTVDRRTSLERALARVRETAEGERPDEGRRALERLAHELRLVQNQELAWAASRLAWSREFPADGRLTSLSNEVERLIGESA